MAPVMFREAAWESAGPQVEALTGLVGVDSDARVLDIPCGPGRHALEFARRGYPVTAVDRTEAYLERGRGKAADREVSVEWVEADMREFCREGAFELIVNLYTSFGYFEDRDENLQVLENFRATLSGGGVLVMELAGKELIADKFKPRTWEELDDGSLFLADRQVSDDWGWMENRWILVDPRGNRHSFDFRHRLYSGVELRTLLREAGFDDVSIFGDLEGADYDRDASRLVAVARKDGEDS